MLLSRMRTSPPRAGREPGHHGPSRHWADSQTQVRGPWLQRHYFQMAQGPESGPQQAFLFAQVPAEGSEGPDRLLSAFSLKKCPFYGAFFGGLTNGGSDIRQVLMRSREMPCRGLWLRAKRPWPGKPAMSVNDLIAATSDNHPPQCLKRLPSARLVPNPLSRASREA